MGEKVYKTLIPIEPNQTEALIKIYSTKDQNPRYIDDSGVSYEGEVLVDMSNTSGGLDREVEVTMDFSEAVITATAKDLNSGNVYQTIVRFSHTYFS